MSNSRSVHSLEGEIPSSSGWGAEEFMSDVDVARNASGQTWLHQASEEGRVDEIRRLLSAGANTRAVEKDGYTPLHCALLSQKEWAAEILAFADPGNDVGDKDGCTPLHEAARKGYLDVVWKLLSGGARTRAQDRWEQTPLVLALLCGKEAAAEAIADADPENNLPDNNELTPLQYAALRGYVGVGRTLLYSSAYPHPISNSGQSALQFAEKRGHSLFVQEILSMYALKNIAFDWDEAKLRPEAVRDYVKHFAKCEEEIRLMKETRIGGVSYHDLATGDARRLAPQLANEDVRRELREGDFELCFDNYYRLIAYRVNSVERFRILKKRCFALLNGLLLRLPEDIIEHILSYFNNAEMQNFVKTFRNET